MFTIHTQNAAVASVCQNNETATFLETKEEKVVEEQNFQILIEREKEKTRRLINFLREKKFAIFFVLFTSASTSNVRSFLLFKITSEDWKRSDLRWKGNNQKKENFF